MVSISSVSALVHGPMLSLYGASKAAMDNFQSAMRVETQRSEFLTFFLINYLKWVGKRNSSEKVGLLFRDQSRN